MKVKILKVSICNSKIQTICQTDYGNIPLFWMKDIPKVNQIYEIELETNQILKWNENIFETMDNNMLCKKNGCITIVGDLESIDEDGYLTLRIDNNIITFMSQGIPSLERPKVKVFVEFMDAYPIEY